MRWRPSLLVPCNVSKSEFLPNLIGFTTSSHCVIPGGPVVFGAISGANFRASQGDPRRTFGGRGRAALAESDFAQYLCFDSRSGRRLRS
jgi:hypothetical protein